MTVYCVDITRQSGEVLYGTSSSYAFYLLVKWHVPWKKSAVDDFKATVFTPDEHEQFQKTLDALPPSRLQLIKQPGSKHESITAYVAVIHETAPRLYRFEMTSYSQLLEIDFNHLLSDSTPTDETPLYLVCTHTNYDRCCGRDGVPVYQALVKQGADVWQTTHIGGHRFAATMICFPHGLYYGFVEPDDIPRIAENYAQNRMVLDRYRGRACYGKLEQVGEYFVRQQSGLDNLSALTLVTMTSIDEAITYRFQDDKHMTHQVMVRQQQRPTTILSATDGEPEEKLIPIYTLLDYQAT